jgi:hypothetical protein
MLGLLDRRRDQYDEFGNSRVPACVPSDLFHGRVKGHGMIQYCCDRCKRVLDSTDELRYVVRVEIEAKFDGLSDEPDEEPDHLLELDEVLERLEDSGDAEAVDDAIYRRQRFDLCPECYRKYVQNPLGRELSAPLGFSNN